MGGGTAGNAIATRLSQGLRNAKILVIEAGPAALDQPGINVPGLKGSTLGGRYDWKFTTTPQPHLNNRTIFTPRGRVLGNTSALNPLTWDRAAAAEYDHWEAVGNPGWNWRTMSTAMSKAETYISGPPGSGTSGPIHALINRMLPPYQRGKTTRKTPCRSNSSVSPNVDTNAGFLSPLPAGFSEVQRREFLLHAFLVPFLKAPRCLGHPPLQAC